MTYSATITTTRLKRQLAHRHQQQKYSGSTNGKRAESGGTRAGRLR
ncbi:hypothetical protein M8494_35900 [Serratia ureilytica]